MRLCGVFESEIKIPSLFLINVCLSVCSPLTWPCASVFTAKCVSDRSEKRVFQNEAAAAKARDRNTHSLAENTGLI